MDARETLVTRTYNAHPVAGAADDAPALGRDPVHPDTAVALADDARPRDQGAAVLDDHPEEGAAHHTEGIRDPEDARLAKEEFRPSARRTHDAHTVLLRRHYAEDARQGLTSRGPRREVVAPNGRDTNGRAKALHPQRRALRSESAAVVHQVRWYAVAHWL